MADILVIDDDDQFRAMLKKRLERSGYEVLEAADGREGTRIFEQEQPNLVITDLIMADKEGIETIVDLCSQSPDVKIIAISGGGRVGAQDYLRTAEALGAQHAFPKPLDWEPFIATVAEMVG